MRGAGVRVEILPAPTGLDAVPQRIIEVADRLGVAAAGATLADRTRKEIEAAKARIPASASRPRVAFLYLRGTSTTVRRRRDAGYLVTPHLLRLFVGPDHRVLLPASAVGGAVLLLAADLAARTVVVPAELPLGVVTALVGGPFFLVLLLRTRRRQGGWG